MSAPDLQRMVRAEQLRALFSGTPTGVVTSISLGLITAGIFWSTLDHSVLIGWFVALIAIGIVRLASWQWFRTTQTEAQRTHGLGIFIASSVAAGLIWGIGGVALSWHEGIANQAFMAFVIAGVSAGAITLLAPDRRAALSFLYPCTLPLALSMLATPGHFSMAMGSMGMIYIAVLTLQATRIEAHISQNILLRLQANEMSIERARVADDLQRLNERFALATQGSGMGVWDWDLTNDAMIWDERMYSMFDLPTEARSSASAMWRAITHPDDTNLIQADIAAAVRESRPFNTKFRIRWRSGEERVVYCTGLIRLDMHGAPDRITGFTRDITELHAVERMKNEFLSTVSHELRTPLTSMRATLGLIMGGTVGALSGKAHELIGKALRNCERLTVLINDILDIEGIESGSLALTGKSTALSILVQQSIEANTSIAEKANVRYIIVGVIPQVELMVDNERFIQVMSHLLSNAVKFSDAGAHVELSARLRSNWVRIEVRDFGPGIAAEFQSRMFQRFSQADASDSRRRGGAGLGLAISKSIVEKMGGRIGFDTQTGLGTTLHIELPAIVR
jgi:signal transduction histidine kinase